MQHLHLQIWERGTGKMRSSAQLIDQPESSQLPVCSLQGPYTSKMLLQLLPMGEGIRRKVTIILYVSITCLTRVSCHVTLRGDRQNSEIPCVWRTICCGSNVLYSSFLESRNRYERLESERSGLVRLRTILQLSPTNVQAFHDNFFTSKNR